MSNLTVQQDLQYAAAFIESALAKLDDQPEPEPEPEPEPRWPVPSTATRVHVSPNGGTVNLADDEDARLVCPDVITGPLVVTGGRNVVIHDTTLRMERSGTRMLYCKGWTGVLDVRRVTLDPGDDPTRDGIALDTRTPGTVAQFTDVSCAELAGTVDGFHADIIQTWAGPETLRMERVRGASNYQGLFLDAQDRYDGPFGRWEFHDVHLVKTPGDAHWCLYVLYGPDDVVVTNCTAAVADGASLELLGKGAFEAHEGAGLTWA